MATPPSDRQVIEAALAETSELTQTEAAELLGVSQKTISRWRSGDRSPLQAATRHSLLVFLHNVGRPMGAGEVDPRSTAATRLKWVRKYWVDLPIESLAELLRERGLDVPAVRIARIEEGEEPVPATYLAAIAELTGVPPAWIARREGSEEPTDYWSAWPGPKPIPYRLHHARRRILHLSREDLAERLTAAGLAASAADIEEWEDGAREPPKGFPEAMERSTGLGAEWFSDEQDYRSGLVPHITDDAAFNRLYVSRRLREMEFPAEPLGPIDSAPNYESFGILLEGIESLTPDQRAIFDGRMLDLISIGADRARVDLVGNLALRAGARLRDARPGLADEELAWAIGSLIYYAQEHTLREAGRHGELPRGAYRKVFTDAGGREWIAYWVDKRDGFLFRAPGERRFLHSPGSRALEVDGHSPIHLLDDEDLRSLLAQARPDPQEVDSPEGPSFT